MAAWTFRHRPRSVESSGQSVKLCKAFVLRSDGHYGDTKRLKAVLKAQPALTPSYVTEVKLIIYVPSFHSFLLVIN